MSIYATWLDLDEETPDVRGPIVYQASHIMPSDDDHRDGTVDVAAIPGFIPHDGRVLCGEHLHGTDTRDESSVGAVEFDHRRSSSDRRR